MSVGCGRMTTGLFVCCVGEWQRSAVLHSDPATTFAEECLSLVGNGIILRYLDRDPDLEPIRFWGGRLRPRGGGGAMGHQHPLVSIEAWLV
jgi:hypothetical protein